MATIPLPDGTDDYYFGVISEIYTVREPQSYNRVVVPGRDGAYDFEEETLIPYDVAAEIIVVAASRVNLESGLDALGDHLSGTLTVDGRDAKVYEMTGFEIDITGRVARGTIVVEVNPEE